MTHLMLAMRDVYAAFYLEKQLRLLRERALTAALDGQVADADFFAREERDIVERQRQLFFTMDIRQALLSGNASGTTDADDFATRSQALLEEAIWMTHRLMVAMPFVGQAEFLDA